MEQRFKLGWRLKDKVTGLQGIAVARIEHLNGCIQYALRPKIDESKSNKIPDSITIDQTQLEKVDDGVSVEPKPTGGDTDFTLQEQGADIIGNESLVI